MNRPVVSMTGFGRASTNLGQRSVVVEIRTLNHRGLDVKLRAHDLQLSPEMETEIVRLVRQSLTRGSVAVSVREEADRGQDAAIDIGRIRQLYVALDSLRQELGHSQPLDLATVGAFLGATSMGSASELPASSWETLAAAVTAALSNLCAMRAEEGTAIWQRSRATAGQPAQPGRQDLQTCRWRT